VSGLAGGQVHEFDHVPADEVEPLRSPDRPREDALHLHHGASGQHLGDLVEELLHVGGLEVLELDRSDLGIDPVLGLAAIGRQRMRVAAERLKRFEPVGDARGDGVVDRCPDAGLDLLVQFLEPVLDLRFGLAADGAAVTLAVRSDAERDRADVALVGPVPRDAVVATVAAFLVLWLRGSHRRCSLQLDLAFSPYCNSRRP
jgi:hypothetical protein